MDLMIRLAYYAGVFALTYYAGDKLGEYLAEKNRERNLAEFRSINAAREKAGKPPLSPVCFDLPNSYYKELT